MININNTQLTLIGALTSKPYAFTARSWELKNTETIDLFESICSNIRIDSRGSKIMRILPVNNEKLNEEWISDKTRFAFDGLERKRFVNPMIKKNNLFVQTNWKDLFKTLDKKFKETEFENIIIKTGNYTDLEHLAVLDKFASNNKNVIINPTNDVINADLQNRYICNSNIFENPKGKQIIILVGIDLRLENPMLNIKLRRLSQKKNVLIGYIGPKHNSNIEMYHLGNNISTLFKYVSGKHQFCTIANNYLSKNDKNQKISNLFKNKIKLVFGNEFNQLKNKSKILNTLEQCSGFKNRFEINTLEISTGKINQLEIGFFNNTKIINNAEKPNLYYLLGVESCKNIKEKDFVIFQGTHNEKIRTKFDVILPSINWTEKSNLYLNCFGMLQKTHTAVTAPINTRSDWKITRMFDLLLQSSLNTHNSNNKNNLTTIDDVHNCLNKLSPNLMNSISNFDLNKKQSINLEINKTFMFAIKNTQTTLKSFISNYYNTNSIDKNSKVMASCTTLLNNKKNNFNIN